MDKTEFYGTKRPLPEYHAITFTHPVFSSPIRLVANQFAEVTLAGNVYTPAPMTLKPPEQRSDAQARLTFAFPRAVVGRAFKQHLDQIAASGSTSPITVTYQIFLGDKITPELSWTLYVSDAGGVAFNAESVQVTAIDDNPMRRGVGVIYDPDVFDGLKEL